MKYHRFTVRLEIPEGATIADVRNYIEDSVRVTKGCYAPDDPIRDLDADSVRVCKKARVTKRKDGKLLPMDEVRTRFLRHACELAKAGTIPELRTLNKWRGALGLAKLPDNFEYE